MRICLFTPNFMPEVGGAERMADTIARGLSARGHDIIVLAQRGNDVSADAGFDADADYDVVRYRRPPAQHLWPEMVSRPLVRLCRRRPLDVVLAFYAYPTGYAATVARRRTGVPVVITPRGGDLYPNFHALRKARVAQSIADGYRDADRLIVISDWIAERVATVTESPRNELPPMDKVPNGIDLDAFDGALRNADAGRPTWADECDSFVLHLARLHEVKQHHVAFEALSQLADDFREHRRAYVIAGEGSERAKLEALASSLNLGDIVRFVGNVADPFKSWLLREARAMVTASREEGMPNTVLEAMAAGVPIVASDIGPHRELIEDHQWGQLFSLGDASELTIQLRALLSDDPAPYREHALQLREQYSQRAMLDGYEASLKHAIDASETAGNS